VNLGVVATHRGDFALARERLTEAVHLARDIGDRNAVVHALVNLGYDCTLRGELTGATAIFEEVLATARAYGLKKHLAYALENLGNVSVLQGDYDRATARLRQSITLGRELSDQHLLLYALGDLTKLAAAQGMPERAARLDGVVNGLRAQLGVSTAPAENEDREYAVRRARETLGALTYERLFADGRTLPLDEALAFALA
jgi:tetratricopeptide (TPR) repeat protein